MPTKEEIQAALADAASGGETLEPYVGATLVITGFELRESQFRDDAGNAKQYVIIKAVTADGDEITVRSGGSVIVPQLIALKGIDAFPVEVVVETFPGQFGKPGYKLEVV